MDYTESLRNGDWQLCIILDACRADIFSQVWHDYFSKGTLRTAVSPASHTMEWLRTVWNGLHDIVYISANPYINSSMEMTAYEQSYNAKEHFPVVMDVWDSGWDDNLGSVPPEKVNAAYNKIKNIAKGKRIILHYIQPHEPFIGERYKEYVIGGSQGSLEPAKPSHGAKKIAAKTIKAVGGQALLWKLRGGKTQYSRIYLAEGWKGVRAAYTENLRLVLEQVVKITDNFEGKILITADHGDFLGEHGLFGHPDKIKKKENTEVPWLEI